MTDRKPDPEQKALAKALDSLASRLLAAYRPLNDSSHRFEHTGWLMLRTAVLMIGHGDRAFGLAGDWCARGYPTGSDDPPTKPGHDPDKLTSVEAASMQSDEWERRRDQLSILRKWLDDNARDIESQIADTIRVRPNEGRRDSLIECANPNCETSMTGIGTDVPRRGRCSRCFEFKLANDRDWRPQDDEAEPAA